ncbi:TraR/DksA C4-type zinc finger protein [Oxalobacteraceae bacterium]|nr:TraR/DksA C4-type zinc finger protein [Oxalobacteraceae bacterium]
MNGLDQQQYEGLLAALEQAQQHLLAQVEMDVATADTSLQQLEASPSDNASKRVLHQLVQESAQHNSQQLRVVRHALAKCGEGSYGLCENCGEAIGYARLNARPEARFCFRCQSMIEKHPPH